MNCPICRKPTRQEYRPFCSKRCADIDLAKWFNGSYAVPSQDPDEAEELNEAMEEALRETGREQ
ncbi:DNA gyrase inhibitor YacG [Sulfitobacter sp. LCG007]